MPDELVFSVDGQKATSVTPITLAEAGLKEREHLQEWVLSNPEIIGSDVFVVTSEFDRWTSRSGSERDRLDVLGLDATGRLVVTELKRDAAPDTVEMQAIKYAAMASRFDIDALAEAHVEFVRRQTHETLDVEEAAERLRAHTEYRVNAETLRAPRIVLIAGSFPANVTSTTVWLSEMGLDVTLNRVQAYETNTGTIITVSQHYPPPDAGDFIVAPSRASRRPKPGALPEVEWTLADYQRAGDVLKNATGLAALDLCSERPDEWVPFEDIIARSGRDPAQARGDMGGFTLTIRAQFKRSNWPFASQWAAGGQYQSYYRMTAEQADMWREARSDLA